MFPSQQHFRPCGRSIREKRQSSATETKNLSTKTHEDTRRNKYQFPASIRIKNSSSCAFVCLRGQLILFVFSILHVPSRPSRIIASILLILPCFVQGATAPQSDPHEQIRQIMDRPLYQRWRLR